MLKFSQMLIFAELVRGRDGDRGRRDGRRREGRGREWEGDEKGEKWRRGRREERGSGSCRVVSKEGRWASTDEEWVIHTVHLRLWGSSALGELEDYRFFQPLHKHKDPDDEVLFFPGIIWRK